MYVPAEMKWHIRKEELKKQKREGERGNTRHKSCRKGEEQKKTRG